MSEVVVMVVVSMKEAKVLLSAEGGHLSHADLRTLAILSLDNSAEVGALLDLIR